MAVWEGGTEIVQASDSCHIPAFVLTLILLLFLECNYLIMRYMATQDPQDVMLIPEEVKESPGIVL